MKNVHAAQNDEEPTECDSTAGQQSSVLAMPGAFPRKRGKEQRRSATWRRMQQAGERVKLDERYLRDIKRRREAQGRVKTDERTRAAEELERQREETRKQKMEEELARRRDDNYRVRQKEWWNEYEHIAELHREREQARLQREEQVRQRRKEEQQRQKREEKQRREREEKRRREREEKRRREREEEECRKREEEERREREEGQRREREQQRCDREREEEEPQRRRKAGPGEKVQQLELYDEKWDQLQKRVARTWSVEQLPWPSFGGHTALTGAAVRAFLLHKNRTVVRGVSSRTVLRRESLRWHMDKFQFIAPLVKAEDWERVAELAEQVQVIINDIMGSL
ncbi:unnamed protein product [Peniophora sp. CBMAI 1063]|nr:unnamed protein product [Peniophora sp. CBMAI 1063]